MFQFDDLQRLSPAPHVSPTQLTSKRILNSLFEASENTLIKKEEALKIAKGLHDFSRRRFYEAWKKVPIERKFGRGKRGPNRHKA